MRRMAIGTALAALGLLTLAACGTSSGAATPGPAGSSSAAVLRTAAGPLGTIVVDAQGRTVYVFDKDAPNSGTSACTGGCAGVWPAVTTSSATPQVDGVTAKVGTIERADGTMQVTLNGLPLYRYAGDGKAGDTHGQGLQHLWWVVSPSGAKITGSAASSSAAAPSASSRSPVY